MGSLGARFLENCGTGLRTARRLSRRRIHPAPMLRVRLSLQVGRRQSRVGFVAEVTTALMPIIGWSRYLLGDILLQRAFHKDRCAASLLVYSSCCYRRCP